MIDQTEFVVSEITSLDEIDLMDRAKEVGDVLNRHYPGHMWLVGWTDGQTLIVKNLAISSFYGFTIDFARLCSATALTDAAVQAGGELLERAGMRRGAWNGEFAKTLEGSEPRFFKPTEN
jgi:hypothetical protein